MKSINLSVVVVNMWVYTSIKIGLVALLSISVDKIHGLQIEDMEGLATHNTNISVLVEPFLHVLASLVAITHLLHAFCWLPHIKFLVVEESISTYQLGKLFLRVAQSFYLHQAAAYFSCVRFFELQAQSSMKNFITTLVTYPSKPDHVNDSLGCSSLQNIQRRLIKLFCSRVLGALFQVVILVEFHHF